MSATAAPIRVTGRRQKTMIWLAVAAGLLLFIGANAHLVYVSFTSQPPCVAHRGPGESGDTGTFSAAESACTPAATPQHTE